MKNIRKVWSNLTSKEEEQSAVAAAKSLHSEMFKSMGSLGSILTLTSRASSVTEEVYSTELGHDMSVCRNLFLLPVLTSNISHL